MKQPVPMRPDPRGKRLRRDWPGRASFIVGVSLFWLWILGPLAIAIASAGVVLGIFGLVRAQNLSTARWWAVVGIVLSVVFLAFEIGMLVDPNAEF